MPGIEKQSSFYHAGYGKLVNSALGKTADTAFIYHTPQFNAGDRVNTVDGPGVIIESHPGFDDTLRGTKNVMTTYYEVELDSGAEDDYDEADITKVGSQHTASEDTAVCNACGWEGPEGLLDGLDPDECPNCEYGDVNFFHTPESARTAAVQKSSWVRDASSGSYLTSSLDAPGCPRCKTGSARLGQFQCEGCGNDWQVFAIRSEGGTRFVARTVDNDRTRIMASRND